MFYNLEGNLAILAIIGKGALQCALTSKRSRYICQIRQCT